MSLLLRCVPPSARAVAGAEQEHARAVAGAEQEHAARLSLRLLAQLLRHSLERPNGWQLLPLLHHLSNERANTPALTSHVLLLLGCRLLASIEAQLKAGQLPPFAALLDLGPNTAREGPNTARDGPNTARGGPGARNSPAALPSSAGSLPPVPPPTLLGALLGAPARVMPSPGFDALGFRVPSAVPSAGPSAVRAPGRPPGWLQAASGTPLALERLIHSGSFTASGTLWALELPRRCALPWAPRSQRRRPLHSATWH